MKKELYDKIANSAIFVVIVVVLTADRFPDYKLLLLGLATAAAAVAVFIYFKNRWAGIEGVESSVPSTNDAVIQIADTFLALGGYASDDRHFAKYSGANALNGEISAEVDLSEYLRNYVNREFAGIGILANGHSVYVEKENPKLKYRRKHANLLPCGYDAIAA